MAYIMSNMTVKEMKEALLKTKTVIIPMGSTEQHGYHLPLSCDMYNAVEVPHRVADRINAVVAPPINYTYSGGELFGTVNVSPQVLSLYLMDICSEFMRMGFKNICTFMGHGGTLNMAAVTDAMRMILKKNNHRDDLIFSVIRSWELSPTWLEIFNKGPQRDIHAGNVETSLMMYWKPEQVRSKFELDRPEVAGMLRTDPDWYEVEEKAIEHSFVVGRPYQRKAIEVGVMGFPEQATVDLGELISREMEEGLVGYIKMLNEFVKK